ncbi:hypothetical protein [Arthrobacter mangrovi]|uniref:Uncharacterized protein n=1 Tax=Arthrobacter mangrovi TaxID=2966350 RepID=A0ABQ5MYQ9_9MICC|nr:hypothetical protein [Arthrobacter mangrovi]GLB69121.1 hypothetical protein AHIS1636_35640 [Arthrobacter mangrovi]
MNELDDRLSALERPENQGEPLDRQGFFLLAGLTLVLPAALLLVGLVFPA